MLDVLCSSERELAAKGFEVCSSAFRSLMSHHKSCLKRFISAKHLRGSEDMSRFGVLEILSLCGRAKHSPTDPTDPTAEVFVLFHPVYVGSLFLHCSTLIQKQIRPGPVGRTQREVLLTTLGVAAMCRTAAVGRFGSEEVGRGRHGLSTDSPSAVGRWQRSRLLPAPGSAGTTRLPGTGTWAHLLRIDGKKTPIRYPMSSVQPFNFRTR